MRLASLLVVVAACGGGSSSPPPDAPDGGGPLPDANGMNASCPTLPALRLESVLPGGLELPVALAFPPGDPTRIFVLEQKGLVRVVENGVLLAEPFLDVQSKIHVGGGGPIGGDTEDGLLGIAFHPDYASNGRMFLYFSDNNEGGQPQVSVWAHTRVDADTGDPAGTRIFNHPHNGYNHLGGTLAFGPDDYLYVSIGEAAWEPNAVDPDVPLGKILRIDVDDPSTRLPGNIAVGHPNVWSWGLRNPYRASFDRATGALYIADVGWGDREEIDVIEPGGAGRDFGWPTREGFVCMGGGTACDEQGVPPVIDHERGEITTIIGGVVYRGSDLPCLVGRYLYADFATGRIFSFVWENGTIRDQRELTDDLNPGTTQGVAAFAEDPSGEVYLVSRQQGRIYKIVAE